MGFLGEQGAESIHASFNSIEQAYLGIPNKDKLLRVTQEHHLRVEPKNNDLHPRQKQKLHCATFFRYSKRHLPNTTAIFIALGRALTALLWNMVLCCYDVLKILTTRTRCLRIEKN